MSSKLRNFIIFKQEKKMMSKRKKNEGGFTLIELIMVIVILGIISAVAIPKFLSLSDSAKLSAARGVGGALGSSISAEHSDYLINGNAYNLDDILSSTAFTSGITYQATPTTSPADGEIACNAAAGAGTDIYLNYKNSVFRWNYAAQAGDTPGLINEDSTSQFP
jgi:prepilin-type N-terminal cleavage/methylation domain-containing protein